MQRKEYLLREFVTYHQGDNNYTNSFVVMNTNNHKRYFDNLDEVRHAMAVRRNGVERGKGFVKVEFEVKVRVVSDWEKVDM